MEKVPKLCKKSVVVREMNPEEKEVVRKLLIDSYRQYERQFTKERWKDYVVEITEAVDNEAIDKLFVATYDEEIVGTVQVFRTSEEAYHSSAMQIDAPI